MPRTHGRSKRDHECNHQSDHIVSLEPGAGHELRNISGVSNPLFLCTMLSLSADKTHRQSDSPSRTRMVTVPWLRQPARLLHCLRPWPATSSSWRHPTAFSSKSHVPISCATRPSLRPCSPCPRRQAIWPHSTNQKSSSCRPPHQPVLP